MIIYCPQHKGLQACPVLFPNAFHTTVFLCYRHNSMNLFFFGGEEGRNEYYIILNLQVIFLFIFYFYIIAVFGIRLAHCAFI